MSPWTRVQWFDYTLQVRRHPLNQCRPQIAVHHIKSGTHQVPFKVSERKSRNSNNFISFFTVDDRIPCPPCFICCQIGSHTKERKKNGCCRVVHYECKYCECIWWRSVIIDHHSIGRRKEMMTVVVMHCTSLHVCMEGGGDGKEIVGVLWIQSCNDDETTTPLTIIVMRQEGRRWDVNEWRRSIECCVSSCSCT